MKTISVYILECSDCFYNTGTTDDIDRIVTEHIEGFNKSAYTNKLRPIVLVFSERFNNVNDAIDFKKQEKGWSRKKKEEITN